MISTLTQEIPIAQGDFLYSQSSFFVVGQNNINGASALSMTPFVVMNANKLSTSECDIRDTLADVCIQIPESGHLIQEVITLCKVGSKVMTIHWIISLFIIVFNNG